MLLEAPGKEEVENNEVIIGKTGRMLWDIMAEYQLRKQDFLIMNSVNCRVLNGKKNGKPSEAHRDCCRPWIRKYIKVFQPRKIILFGNFALHTILGI
jgi:uracil-DNA glycosylase family 4